jgi:hypothetical protein
MGAPVPRLNRPGVVAKTGPPHVPPAIHLAFLLTQRLPRLRTRPDQRSAGSMSSALPTSEGASCAQPLPRSGPSTQPCIPHLGLVITPDSPMGGPRGGTVPVRHPPTGRVLRDQGGGLRGRLSPKILRRCTCHRRRMPGAGPHRVPHRLPHGPNVPARGTKTRFVGVRASRATDARWAHVFWSWVRSTLDANAEEGKEAPCHNSSVNGVAPPIPPPLAYIQASRRSDNPAGRLGEPGRSVAIAVGPRIWRRAPFD